MKEQTLLKLIFFHLLIGLAIYFTPLLAKIYAFIIVIIGIYYIVKNKNSNHEVLYVSAYLVGSEVFLRTTYGNPCYEFGKYLVTLFILVGIFYSGISKKAYPYWVFLFLLIPSILLSFFALDNDNIRRKIFFDVFGPICLAICSLYTFKKKITSEEINDILLFLGLPIIACCSYLFMLCPIKNFVITNTESNFLLSGGYAPNQISTLLGLGMLIFFSRLFIVSSTKRATIITLIIASYIYYRGLLTFSRGGLITGFIIVNLFIFSIVSKNYNSHKKQLIVLYVALLSIFVFTNYQTDDLLFKRYANQNPSGLYKSPEINGREDMALEEINFFKDNPVIGIGVGKGKEIRQSEYGTSISTHSEMTRMLAEHGSLGMLSLVILIVVPVLLFFKNKQNIYFLSFFSFWFLTINHSGMRIAAPAFIYALTLLDVDFSTSNSI